MLLLRALLRARRDAAAEDSMIPVKIIKRISCGN
jgi:hypothetical protein